MGTDRGQPDPPSWPPPEDASPDARALGPDARAPGREWYPGTEWYPGREYRPPRYGETRYRGPVHVPAGEYSSRQQEHREMEYRDEYPPRGRHSIPGPTASRRRRRHQVRNGMLVGLGCLSVIAAVGTGLTGGKFPASSPQSHPAASTGQPAAAAPAAAQPRSKSKSRSRSAGSGPRPILIYRVTGTPGARVTYGPAGTYLTGRAPLQVVARLGNPLYYFISAELPGKGSVECEILIGTTVMNKSVATGRHSLASCQISRDPLSGKWQDAAGG